MKGWYFCVVVAGLLLSSCSQQVQERADGGKTSDTIVAEGPVEESCDSTGYRLYRKYLAAIGENPSYFQWKDFYLCEIRRFRADEPTVAVFDTVCYDARDRWTIYVHVKALDYNMPEYFDSLYRYIGEFRKKVLLSRWVQVDGKYTVVTGVDLDEIKVKE